MDIFFHAAFFGVNKNGNALSTIHSVRVPSVPVAQVEIFIDIADEDHLLFRAGAQFM